MAKTSKKTTAKVKKVTPLMQQYNTIKGKYPDAILLFRVGDFYETFGADAIKAAEVLGIVLTKRGAGSPSEIELAGFPYHSLNTYLPKLVRGGFRVAICEQLEKPSKEKKIVKRGVTELITPGVATNDQILNHKKPNYLASIYWEKDNAGVCFVDVSTGEFLVAEGKLSSIDKLLQSFNPAEVLYKKSVKKQFDKHFGNSLYAYPLEEWIFSDEYAKDILLEHFKVNSLKGFGLEKNKLAQIAAGTVIHYLRSTEHAKLDHLKNIQRIWQEEYVLLDPFTIRNLELVYPSHDDGKSLLDVMDATVSPMGARLLKQWIVLPSTQLKLIEERQQTVEICIKDPVLLDDLIDHLKGIGDLERLIAKVSMQKVNPRELNYLKNALQRIAPIKKLLLATKKEELVKIGDRLDLCHQIVDKLEQTIEEEAPVNINKGNVIKFGVSEELDEYKTIRNSGKSYLVEMQEREAIATGITSLKIGFNNVFGYYLEVRNTHKDRVPEEWIRKQTLTSGERYITEELKTYETKINEAEEKISVLEEKIFNDLVLELMDYITPIQTNAKWIAKLDVLTSFAFLAKKMNYARPKVNDSGVINIKNGRHPVIEQQMPLGEAYVPNDIYLDQSNQQILMITGPNMSGKSALLRQTALIALIAQMGSYVPAESAEIGYVDKIFTRVGASDNISSGESTFMVEMNETANILNNLSERSLILLDEIGRGTSTYDGISIAWSIAEYLHEITDTKPRTLFATHYHELNELAKQFDRVKNFHVTTKEYNQKVIFLRKLKEGGSEHSFGIHVAKMAGMPKPLINRATQILTELESQRVNNKSDNTTPKAAKKEDYQLSFFQLDDPLVSDLRSKLEHLDIDTLTPIEALLKLNDIKKSLNL